MKRIPMLFAVLFLVIPLFPQGNPETVNKIIEEGKTRNQVMRHLEHLCIQIGHRLTGSHNLQKACEWTRDMFASYGLNARLEQWGEVPVGFQRGRTQIGRMVEPHERIFQFTTRSWTAGTNGLVRGYVVMQPENVETIKSRAWQLKNTWVLVPPPPRQGGPSQEERTAIRNALREAGINGTITSSGSELLRTSGTWRNLDINNLPTDVDITVRQSDYQAIANAINAGTPPLVEFHLEQYFIPGPMPQYNVIADIVGTEFPDEYVMVGGHLDSWDGPGSQGTCDNGTGTMVALEAARILMASGAKPKRTIRFILFTGEEQGLLGSRAYVQQNPQIHSKISAVLIDDGGTNYWGGLVCIKEMESMLKQATDILNEAFPDLPFNLRVVERMPRGGGSDHASFNAVGIPGFFSVETGVANYPYMHHTQNDNLSAAIEKYLVQSSVAAAVTAYNLACADTMLPREQPTRDDGLKAVVAISSK